MRQQSDQLILFLLLPLQLGALSSSSLLNWATGHGAYVAPELCISEASPVSPRALRVARDVPEGAVLCTLPSELQLGAGQLQQWNHTLAIDAATAATAAAAAYGDEDDTTAGLQRMLSAIGPGDGGAWSARLALSLAAELQRGQRSTFSEYVSSLPLAAPAGELASVFSPAPGGFGEDDWRDVGCDASPALSAWPPTAQRCAAMRRSLRTLYGRSLAAATASPAAGGGSSSGGSGGSSGGGGSSPPPVSFRDFSWATAICGSRAFRVRGRGASSEGAAAAETGDMARLLPIIDLVNHAPSGACNAELRNAQKSEGEGTIPGSSDDPYAVSLYASRSLAAGEEVTVDYSYGKGLSNERLLLEYGFCLPDNPHDELVLPLEAIAVGLDTYRREGGGGGEGDEQSTGAEEEAAALGNIQAQLLGTIGVDIDATGLVFHRSGTSSRSALTPTTATMGIAMILSARRASELEGHSSVASLVAAAEEEESIEAAAAAAATTILGRRARAVLRAAGAAVLKELGGASPSQSASEGDGAGCFEDEARKYCASRLAMLRCFVDQGQ